MNGNNKDTGIKYTDILKEQSLLEQRIQVLESIESSNSPLLSALNQSISIEKEQLDVLKNIQKTLEQSLELKEEQEYEDEHSKKLKEKYKPETPDILETDDEKQQTESKSGFNLDLKGITKFLKKEFIGLITKLFAGAALIAAAWPEIKEQLNSFVEYIADKGPELVENAWNVIKDMASNLMDMIIEYGPGLLKNAISALGAVASSVMNGIIEYGPKLISMLYDGLKQLGSMMINGIIEYTPKILSLIWDGLSTLASDALDGIASILDTLSTKLSDYIFSISGGLFGTKQMDENSSKELNQAASQGNILSKADDYGIIDHNYLGKSTIKDKDKLGTMDSKSLQALIDSGDFGKEDNAVIQGLLDSKSSKNKSSKSNDKNNPVSEMVGAYKNQFAEGGYTGKGDSKEIAGVVHKNEYVLSEDALKEIQNAKDEGEKDAKVEKKSKDLGVSKEAILKTVKRSELSDLTVIMNGAPVTLTNAQKEDYLKAQKKDKDNKDDFSTNEMKLLESIQDKSYKDDKKYTVKDNVYKGKAANNTKSSKQDTLSTASKPVTLKQPTKKWGIEAKKEERRKHIFDDILIKRDAYLHTLESLKGMNDKKSLKQKKKLTENIAKIDVIVNKLNSGIQPSEKDYEFGEYIKNDKDNDGSHSLSESASVAAEKAEELTLGTLQKTLVAIGVLDKDGNVNRGTSSPKPEAEVQNTLSTESSISSKNFTNSKSTSSLKPEVTRREPKQAPIDNITSKLNQLQKPKTEVTKEQPKVTVLNNQQVQQKPVVTLDNTKYNNNDLMLSGYLA